METTPPSESSVPFSTTSSSADELLIEYVRNGDEAMLSSALKEGRGDPHLLLPHQDPDASDGTLLCLAAANGHHHLLPLLLEAGCALEDKGKGSRTPLHYAVANGHQLVCRTLLRKGADKEAISKKEAENRPLHIACAKGNDIGIVELLLAEGAEIDAENNTGRTALHEACDRGREEVVRILIESGSNLEAPTFEKWRPLHRAAFLGHADVVSLLLDKGAEIEACASWGNRAVHYAALRGNIEVLEVLKSRGCDLNSLDKKMGNAVFGAAGSGRLQTIQWLVDHGVPHNVENEDGRTALDMAHLYGYHHVAWCLHKMTLSEKQYEHRHHETSLEECDRIGMITLKWCREGTVSSLSVNLPSRPYRIHYQDEKGWTPLHHAAFNNQEDVVVELLRLGALPTARNYDHDTSFDLAHRQGHHHLLPHLHVSSSLPSRCQRVSQYGDLLMAISCTELKTATPKEDKKYEKKLEQKEQNRRWNAVKTVSELLKEGTPLEPLGGYTVFPLHLAIRTNCTDLLPLLLCGGAPLTTTTGGLSVLELAWFTPEVTTHVGTIISRAFANSIQHELCLIGKETDEDEILRSGVESLLQELNGKTPWKASWRTHSHDTINLTEMLERACRWGATIVASFIQRAGGSLSTLSKSGRTSLHAALDAGQVSTANALVRHLGANLFLKDAEGRMPLGMWPDTCQMQLLEDAISHDYRVLDFRLDKARNAVERQNVQYILLLLAALYSECDLYSLKNHGDQSLASVDNWKDTFIRLVELHGYRNKENSDSDGQSTERTQETTEETSTSKDQSANSPQPKDKKNFVDDDWLRYLLCKLSALQNPETQEQMDKDGGKADALMSDVKEGDESDVNIAEEELFFLVIERIKSIKTKTEFQTNQSSYDEFIKATLQRAFTFCCESGLQLFIQLLLTVSGVNVNEIIDPISGSTALHLAASHGRLGLCEYLLSHKASTRALDRAKRTPAHLAYLFGHSNAGNCLCSDVETVRDNAKNCPRDLFNAYKQYMKMYGLDSKIRVASTEKNNATSLTKAHLEQFKWKWRGNFLKAVRTLHVDFTKGEAFEVKRSLQEELERIVYELGKINPLLEGKLRVLGSSADNLRLYAPDEFDCNVVLDKVNGFPGGGINMELKSLPPQLAAMKGYTTCLSVTTTKEELRDFLEGPNFINIFFESLHKCLVNFEPKDERISFVLPGLRKTQVGANISFTWEGKEYPLMLIDVDMVPTLKAPWPHDQEKPPLTPGDLECVNISNTGDGDWRYSFASVENMVLKSLSTNQRNVFLACKLLIASLKIETWAPRDVKEMFTYYDGRRFKIPAPAGFILKAAFMHEMEEFVDDSLWEPSYLQERMISVFRRMCQTSANTETGKTEIYHNQVKAYFGGDTEKPTIGLGAPEILRLLESWTFPTEQTQSINR